MTELKPVPIPEMPDDSEVLGTDVGRLKDGRLLVSRVERLTDGRMLVSGNGTMPVSAVP